MIKLIKIEKYWELFRQKLNKFIKGSGKNFSRFLLAFTGIFLVLAALIIQTTRAGMYSSTDNDLRSKAMDQAGLIYQGQNSFANFGAHAALPNDQSNSYNNVVSDRPLHNAGNYVVLYDPSGAVINYESDPMAAAVKAENRKVDTSFSDDVGSYHLDGQSFRTIVVKLDSLQATNGSVIGYIQIFQNVNQIEDSLNIITFEVIITMIAFWFVSLFVSVYLSRVSLRPVEAALERQKAFVSNASHELRTPLAIMQNRLQLLFQNPDATILQESENISASLNEVRNMRVLTSNLLNMAKSDGAIEPRPVDTNKIFFEEVFENYGILSHERQRTFNSSINFGKDHQGDNEKFKLDQDLFKQVMTILFDNSTKYTDEGGEIDMSLTLFKSKNELQLVVADNGLGISIADKKKIFDRFFRVDEARTRGKGGLGLGLSLANEIVTAMKGKITVEDNKPKGTKFIVKVKI
ncbi:HAMP domain-containing sensor histidine kinase [Lactovum miscens]|uniref:sensor histidine kinase n=1 Tax=Lactovum miscens TaxID=190387 RepID=UPI002EDB7FFA